MLSPHPFHRRVLRRTLDVRRTALLASLLAAAPQAVRAQTEGNSAPVADTPTSDGEAPPTEDSRPRDEKPVEPASLRLILFIEADPDVPPKVELEGAKITVDGQTATTSDTGVANLNGISEGRHAVELELTGGTRISVEGVAFAHGETSQVLLTVDGAGQEIQRDVEAPELADAEIVVAAEKETPKLPGKLLGRAVDAETGKPIAGVQVYVRGVDEPVTTDAQGRFELEILEGEHDLSALHGKYASESREGIQIAPDGTTEIELKMNPSSAELEDLVIVEPYVQGGVSSGVAEEKESTAVQDVIGAEQMSKSGDSDASSALSRVTGLTVVGGKFVYVRGMGERYSSTLLNGAQVPSPEPERRVVPLDLFPTAVLESVVVQKTYSPNMPAEFGGGVIQLRTRSYPEEFLFKVGGSLSANTETTFQKGPTYDGGSTDWLGFDDGSRERSAALADESRRGEPLVEGNRFTPGLTADEINELGASLPNNWNTRQRTLPPEGKLSVTAGDTFEVGGASVGYVVAGQYGNEWQNTDEVRRSVQTSGGDVLVATSYDLQRATNTIGLTGMGAIGVEFMEGQELFSNTMVLRTSDNTTLLGEGQGLEGGERFARLRFVERQLFTQQFRGEHVFAPLNDFQLDWRFVYSIADRSEPDRRDYRYDYLDGQQDYFLSVRGGAVQRFYSELDDTIIEGGGDMTYPIAWTEELVTKLKAGAMILNRAREVTTYRYQYRIDQYEPVDERNALRQEDMETILDRDNIRSDGVNFAETTGEDEPYDADQNLYAGYGMVETPVLTEDLNLMAGLRYEASRQQVESTNQSADLNTGDWLPAGTLTWAFIEDMQLRAGFSRTVSRPDFRELSLARFFDVESSTEIIGNPNLKRATINHYDLRWEWYFSGDESLSVAGFFKQFDDPIETVVLAGTSRRQSWQNADSATNLGVELEARKRLGFLGDFLDSFYVATNLSLIRSAVQLSDSEDAGETVNTSSERALEGQSPYVLNVQLGYDDVVGAEGSLSVTALFNIAGRRIIGVGANGAPDIYEEPFPRLDFVARHKVDDHWTWGFKASNLLNPYRLATQGPVDTIKFKKGLDFSLGATYTY